MAAVVGEERRLAALGGGEGGRLRGHAAETLLHFSEDPSIELFRPHVPASNPGAEPAVWAIDEERAPLYWFPRWCPRVTCWRVATTDPVRAAAAIGHTTAPRVHAIEWGWLERMRTAVLYAYELPASPFTRHPQGGGWTSAETVEPLAVREVGDLLGRHAEAGIELRLVHDLWAFHVAVVASTLAFSTVRIKWSSSYRPDELPVRLPDGELA